MVKIQVNDVGAQQAPPLAGGEAGPVVAQCLSPGVAKQHRHEENGAYREQRETSFSVAIERREPPLRAASKPVHRPTRNHLLSSAAHYGQIPADTWT